MKKLFLLILITASFTSFCQSKINTGDEDDFFLNQRWAPFKTSSYKPKQIDYSLAKYAKLKDLEIDKIQNKTCKINYPETNTSKVSINDWERLPGPYGGCVREFYKFDDELYLRADGDIFILENKTWNSLNFSSYNFSSINCFYKFKNGRMWASGDYGLYYSDNKGVLWTKAYNYSDTIKVFNVYDMGNNNYWLSTSKGIYLTQNGELNFSFIGLKDIPVYKISCDKMGNIFACTNKGIYKSSLQELNWKKLPLEDTYYTQLLIDSQNTIYTFSRYKIFMSKDFGESWYSLSGNYISDISLSPENDIIISSFYNIYFADSYGIKKTSSSAPKFLLNTFVFNNEELLVGTLGAGAVLYNVKNDSFSGFNHGMNVSTLRGLVPMKNGELLACTDADSFYISKDNGNTWKSSYKSWSRYMKTSSSGIVYAGSLSGIIKSTDYGTTWSRLGLDVNPYYINAFDVSDDDKIICAGSSTGVVFISNDSGKTFTTIKKQDYNFVDAIKIVNDKTYLISCGYLYFTKDGGKTLNQVNDSLVVMINDFATDKKGNLYLSGPNGIFRSQNIENWELVYKGGGVNYLRTDQMNNFYAIFSNGEVFSFDFGKNWEKISQGLYNMAFWSFALTRENYFFMGSQNKGLFRKHIDSNSHINPEIVPANFDLSQNYPNPFNGSTIIKFYIPSNSYVELKLYDILGREVQTLISEFKYSGYHYVTWTPQNQSSGVYICKLQAGNGVKMNKLIYLK